MKISIWVCCPRSVCLLCDASQFYTPKVVQLLVNRQPWDGSLAAILLNLMKLLVFTPSSLFGFFSTQIAAWDIWTDTTLPTLSLFASFLFPPGGHGDMFVMGLWTSLVKFMPWYSQTDRKCLLTCNIDLSFLQLTKSDWSIDISVYSSVRLYVITSLFTDSY